MRCARSVVALLLLLVFVMPATPVQAAGVVDVCDEAHLLAALSDGGTVTFTCDGAISLSATVTIATDTTIDASGRQVLISGGDAVRLFTVSSGVRLDLKHLTIANGRDNGSYLLNGPAGGVVNFGTLAVDDSAFLSNANGAIFNAGPVAGPGPIVAPAVLTVMHSVFEGNTLGSAIENRGELTVSNSIFTRNSTAFTGPGGAISNSRHADISYSSFSGNSASVGGAMANLGSGGEYALTGAAMAIRGSTFSGNWAVERGGAIYNSAYLWVGASTFSDNGALTDGGAIFVAPGSTLGPHPIPAATMLVSNSTFWNNVSQTYGVTNGAGGFGASCSGFNVTNSTFSRTRLSGACKMKLQNTIVANPPWDTVCSGYFDDGSGNISYPDSSCPGTHADPELGPLQDNGGPTLTMALGTGSAAVDAGNDAVCAEATVNNRDQRGFPRPVGAHCDSGALEAGRITIEGPAKGRVGASYTFTATLSAIEGTVPITYVWSATDQPPVTHTVSSGSDQAVFTWSTGGAKTVTVTATIGVGSIVSSSVVQIAEPIFLPLLYGRSN